MLLTLVVMLGCRPSNPLGRRAIAGLVTLDGAPVATGHIGFFPAKPEGVASGAMIVDGKYRMETNQGLPPGKYNVRISSPQESKKSAASTLPAGVPPPGIEQIPRRYNAETTLVVEVTDSGPTTFDFELKAK